MPDATPRDPKKGEPVQTRSEFPPTRWSLVRAATADPSAASAMAALEEWCVIYRKPIVVAARVKHGLSAADAEDIAQEFITWLLRRQHLSEAVPMEGSKFRSFLLTYLGNFVSNWKQRLAAAKRGGNVGEHLLVHDSGDDARPMVEIAIHAPPDDEVDRAWVVATLKDVRTRLKADYAQRGKARECHVLLKSLSASERISLGALARELDISDGAMKVRVHRFREEFRVMLRSVVRETVSSPEDLEDEIALVRRFAAA